jgi:hypothetical protein
MFRIDVGAMAIALLLLFFACTSEPLPIGTERVRSPFPG